MSTATYIRNGCKLKTATITQKQYESLPVLLNVEETAALLRIHPRTVQSKARKGELPGKFVGGKWRFNKAKIAELAGIE